VFAIDTVPTPIANTSGVALAPKLAGAVLLFVPRAISPVVPAMLEYVFPFDVIPPVPT
jgi:hypothetical protein